MLVQVVGIKVGNNRERIGLECPKSIGPDEQNARGKLGTGERHPDRKG